jgi:hypothetical protein
MRRAVMAGPTIALYAAIPPRVHPFLSGHFYYDRTVEFCDRREKAQRINPGRSRDHNLGRNTADDAPGASAAIGATDIHPRDGSGDSARSPGDNNKAFLVGNPGQRKRETLHLLWIR